MWDILYQYSVKETYLFDLVLLVICMVSQTPTCATAMKEKNQFIQV